MKIGDKVRFLSETGGGVIAGFQGKDIVLVEDEDGFQIPTQRNEVVVIDTDDYDIAKNQSKDSHAKDAASESRGQGAMGRVSLGFMEDEEQEPADRPVSFRQPVEERKGGDRLSVYLAFVPIDIRQVSTTPFEAYIVNDSNYYIRYAYMSAEGTSYKLRAVGEVEPNTKVFIEEFGRSELGELERVAVQLMAYKRDKPFLLKPPVDVQLRIDGVKFYKLHTFQENDFFEEPALVYTLIENDRPMRPLVVDAKALKQEMFASKRHDAQPARRESQQQMRTDLTVVDLHAEALLDTTAGMSAADILNYQMSKFHEALKAHAHQRGHKVVFIHGKGEGVLRQSIIHELKYRYKGYSYQDASFQEYGYGATQVTIR